MSLGEAAVDVVADTSKFEGGLSKSVKAVGKAAVGVAAGIGAIGGAAVAGAFKVSELADTVDKASQRAGVTAETYQELAYWAGQNGVSAEQMEKAVGRLNLTMGDAASGNKTAQKAFDDLGVSILDANGNLRSTDDVTKDALNALAGLEDPALRASKAADLFGMRQAQALQPALSETALTMKDATAEAERLGLVMGDDVVAAGVRFGDTWDRIKQGTQAVLRDALVPVMEFMLDTVFPVIENKIIPTLRDLWETFQEGDGVVDGVLGVFKKLTGSGGISSIFAKVSEVVRNAISGIVDWLAGGGITMILNAILEGRQRLFDAALRLFPAILDALISFLPTLLEAITGQVIPQLVEFLVSGVPQLLEAAVTLFTQLVTAVVEILPVLVETLLGTVLPNLLETVLSMIPQLLDTALTLFDTLVEAVVTVLPELLTTILTVVLPKLLTTILEMAPSILTKAIETFLAMVTGLLKVLPELVSTLIGEVLPTLLSTLIEMIPELLETAITVFLALVTAIVEALPEIVDTIVTELIPAILGAVLTLGTELFEAGKNVMNELWDGIKEIGRKISGWIEDNVVQPIKDLWPFSPAKEGPFKGRGSPLHAGQNIMAQLADGIRRGAGDVVSAAQAVTRDLQGGISAPSIAAAGGVTLAAGAIVIQITGSVSDTEARRAGELAGEAALERISRSRRVQ